MRKLGTYLVIILLATVSFLFSPRSFPPEAIQKWGDFYIKLTDQAGVRVNGDAFAFVALAIHPSLLFGKDQVRQSRPAYIMAANLLGSAIYFISSPLHPQLETFFQDRIKDKFDPKSQDKIAWWFSCYTAYILLNFGLLVLVLYLFDSLVVQFSGPWKTPAIRWLFLFLLIDNPITKLFFWSPHVQLFNLLTPLLMVWVCSRFSQLTATPKRMLALSFATGLLVLFYGSFTLLLPAMLTSLLYPWYLKKQFPDLTTWKQAASISLLFLVPVLTWMLAVTLRGHPFYSAELAEYRQFIWIADSLQNGPGNFLASLFKNSVDFLISLASLLMPVTVLVLSLLFKPGASVLPSKASTTIFINFLFTLLFFWLLGYYADRLSYNLAGFIFLLAAWNLNQVTTKFPVIILYAITICWHLLLVSGNPSFFSNIYFN